MPEELHELAAHLTGTQTHRYGDRDYLLGTISGQEVVLVESGIGKVAAGITVEHLITDFKVDLVLNSGSAGGIGTGLHVGDVVVATATAYHDVDVTAFGYEYGQLPQQPARFPADPTWVARLMQAGAATGLTTRQGLIVSGDQFVASQAAIAKIKAHFPTALSAEMEGAAVGQVATSHQVPYVVVRAMSDTADEAASQSFDDFIIDAGRRSAKMLLQLLHDYEGAD